MKKNQNQSSGNNKSNKKHTDWVCTLCSNLNFSFRDICNRCRNITREQNQTFRKTQIKQRNPLEQLNLNRHYSYQQKTPFTNNEGYFFSSDRNGKYKQIVNTSTSFYSNETALQNSSDLIQNTNLGFSSILFLTPSRYSKNNQNEIDQDPNQRQNPNIHESSMFCLLGSLMNELN